MKMYTEDELHIHVQNVYTFNTIYKPMSVHVSITTSDNVIF